MDEVDGVDGKMVEARVRLHSHGGPWERGQRDLRDINDARGKAR